MSIDKAVSSNWIVESFTASGNDIQLVGSGVGYSSFKQGFKDGDTVPYALFDDALNREAGYATYQGDKLVNRTIKATLVNGVYSEANPSPVVFPNGGTAACTFNAAAFDDLWAHLFDTDNPHEVFAGQIDQNNPELGDSVQDALDTIHENLGDHISNEGNPHNTTADLVALNPVFEPAGDNVQVALEKIYAQFHTAKNNDDLHLNYADGDETFIQMKRNYEQSPSNPKTKWHWPHGSDDVTGKGGEASDSVGELTFYANEGRVYTYLNNGTYVLIASQYFIEDSVHDGETYARKDGEWVKVTSTIIGDLPPTDPKLGTLWYDTGTTAELFVYDGSAWISMTGAGGGSGVTADNVVLDDAEALDRNRALAREIDSVGNGKWRPIYTSDLVTENSQPMFRDDRGRFTKSDSAVIRNQQDANWYLLDRIEEIGNVIISDTAPDLDDDNIGDGSLWFDNSEDVMQLFIWHDDSGAWVPVAPPTTLEGRVATGEATQDAIIAQIQESLEDQAKIAAKVEELSVTKGATARYVVKGTSINVATRNGELYVNSPNAVDVTYISFAPFDSNGQTTKPANPDDIVEFVEAVGGKNAGEITRYKVVSGDSNALTVEYLAGNNDFEVNETEEVYVYPQNQDLASIEYVDESVARVEEGIAAVEESIAAVEGSVGATEESLKAVEDSLGAVEDGLDAKLENSGTNQLTDGTDWKVRQHTAEGKNKTLIQSVGGELGLYNLKTPTESHHAATKGYVDSGGAAGLRLDIWTYMGWNYDKALLNDGEFCSKEFQDYVEIYLARNNSRGEWYHPTLANSTSEYSYQVTGSGGTGLPMTITDKAGKNQFFAEPKKFVFNSGSTNYTMIEVVKVRRPADRLITDTDYMLNIPGLIGPVAGW